MVTRKLCVLKLTIWLKSSVLSVLVCLVEEVRWNASKHTKKLLTVSGRSTLSTVTLTLSSSWVILMAPPKDLTLVPEMQHYLEHAKSWRYLPRYPNKTLSITLMAGTQTNPIISSWAVMRDICARKPGNQKRSFYKNVSEISQYWRLRNWHSPSCMAYPFSKHKGWDGSCKGQTTYRYLCITS